MIVFHRPGSAAPLSRDIRLKKHKKWWHATFHSRSTASPIPWKRRRMNSLHRPVGCRRRHHYHYSAWQRPRRRSWKHSGWFVSWRSVCCLPRHRPCRDSSSPSSRCI